MISPAGGDVPAHFTAWVFLTDREKRDTLSAVTAVDDEGKPIPTSVNLLSREAYHAFRIDVAAAPGQNVTLSVKATDELEQTASFVTIADWKPPERNFAIADVRSSSFNWMCSGEDAVVLRFNRAAPAYRVTWAHSIDDWLAGHTQSFVVPAMPSAFWPRWRQSKPEAQCEVSFGVLDCFGPVLQAIRTGPVVAAIAAIDLDGIESPMTERRVLDLSKAKSEPGAGATP